MVQERAWIEGPAAGLGANRLSQGETFGQSLASVAPTATPAMVIPLVLAACGQGAWLAYLLATLGVACLTSQINFFASRSASPGSLYNFVNSTLGKWPSLISGWALFIAYAGTAAAVSGGVTSYAYALVSGHAQPSPLFSTLLTALALGLAAWLAYRDVQLSARLMLWIEALSVLLILALFLWPGHPHALHWDRSQLLLQKANFGTLRNGLVLAIFSFVGFESAAVLGAEAAHPRQTIPRAIRLTAFCSGLFFIFATYAEEMNLGDHAAALASSGAPLQLIARLRGLAFLVPLLSIGAVISFFACTLACVTAGARTLFAMSRDGYLPRFFGATHKENFTPHPAVLTTALLALLTALPLVFAGVSPFDLYGWVGTIATYGFVTVYLAVTAAALLRRHLEGVLTLSSAAVSAGALIILLLAAWSSIDFNAPAPARWFPGIYLLLLLLGMGFSWISRSHSKAKSKLGVIAAD
jgi:amino acid transporter